MSKKCGATTRNGKPCDKPPMNNGTGRCDRHGGKTPNSLALPQTKHGRYSKYMPQRMLGRYVEAKNDPDLLEQTAEVALLQTRIEELLSGVEWAASGDAWRELRKAWVEVLKWKGDADFFAMALTNLGQIITRGNLEYDAWQEIADLIERKRRVVESERKRKVELDQYITTQQAMLFATALLQSVRNHADPKAYPLIAADFIRLLGADGGGWVTADQDARAGGGMGEMP